MLGLLYLTIILLHFKTFPEQQLVAGINGNGVNLLACGHLDISDVFHFSKNGPKEGGISSDESSMDKE